MNNVIERVGIITLGIILCLTIFGIPLGIVMILMGFRRKIIPMTKNQLIEEAVKYYKKCDEGIHSWIKLESNLPAGRQHSFRCYFCGEELEGFHCSGGSPSGKGRHYSCHLFETPDEYIRRIRKELELKNRE